MLVHRGSIPAASGIRGCEVVPVSSNRDERGCLYEIFRQSWAGAFPAVQWNVCSSKAGVVRGAHVHIDYDEFYTLPLGRVVIGLSDIREDSATFGNSVQFDWSDQDCVAIVVPRGVAHVVMFESDSVLAFGLSDYWKREYDVLGCQWNAPEFGFDWPRTDVRRSERDETSGGYDAMLTAYSEFAHSLADAD